MKKLTEKAIQWVKLVFPKLWSEEEKALFTHVQIRKKTFEQIKSSPKYLFSDGC